MAGNAISVISGNVLKNSLGFKTVGAKDTPLLNFTIRWSYFVGAGKGYNNSGYDSAFMDCEVWGKYAEMLAEKLTDDQIVTVYGKLKQDRWEKDGDKKSKFKLTCDSVVLGGVVEDAFVPKEKTAAPEASLF
jgi:hypothetical protein